MPQSLSPTDPQAASIADPETLKPLRDAIIYKPPYVSGTLPLPPDSHLLYYGSGVLDGHARRINLANASPQELDDLAGACQPAGFGLNHENVYDETYRKAGKMDTDTFSTPFVPERTTLVDTLRSDLLEGLQSSNQIIFELYKLNVYGKGSFFKAHQDTPRSTTMFGSLVLVFPTSHEGGALVFRHRGEDWTVDSAKLLATAPVHSVAFVAFFSDVQHEVSVVESGHRVTLTYNLYFGDVDSPSSSPAVPLSAPPNEAIFKAAFERLLADPTFLPNGGTLGFGLRHVYPIKKTLRHIRSAFKGSDAVVWRVCQELGVAPAPFLVYDDPDSDGIFMVNRPPDELGGAIETLTHHIGGYRTGKIICLAGWNDYVKQELDVETYEHVNWVTDLTDLTQHESTAAWYGNETSVEHVYGKACIIVRVGKPGERQTTAEETPGEPTNPWD
ncbi:hypothetical protein BV25DRAFT_1805391 [Artomyces pyxidatus]|uniref:Uncharacterized protein n=1 Tax=Artomyces pyxidatus TaxID=48021 RepID=A0ACB8SZX1_9AGAM|nr:hypothetical protein BV25DRAFT_1805391 [Artomyces pyxidatus]